MSQLEAGRELDALVAERVMGDIAWDYVIEGCSRCGREFATVADAEAHRANSRYLVGPIVLHSSVPAYSTDMNDAWRVVEKMREQQDVRFVNLQMTVYSYSRTYATFDSKAWYDYTPETWAEGNGEYATPLAICRAALMAISEVSRA